MAGRLEAEWGQHSSAVFGVAYRLLGSVADAEDVVQDVWLRAAGVDLDDIVNLRAWLVTTAARRSHDILKSARVRRESYHGPWLPEPLLTSPDAAEPVLLDESVATAMLLVMERLSPPERIAFVLHDVLEWKFAYVADVLGATVSAARKLGSRARRRITASGGAISPVPRPERERLLRAFRDACRAGDFTQLVELMHPEIVGAASGGEQDAPTRAPISGNQLVADVLMRVVRRRRPAASYVRGERLLCAAEEDTPAHPTRWATANGSASGQHRILEDTAVERSHPTRPDRLPDEESNTKGDDDASESRRSGA